MSDKGDSVVQVSALLPDAVVDLWLLLAESLIASGALEQEVICAVLSRHEEEFPGTLSAYMARRALMAYRSENQDSRITPDWLHGVVDGGRKD